MITNDKKEQNKSIKGKSKQKKKGKEEYLTCMTFKNDE